MLLFYSNGDGDDDDNSNHTVVLVELVKNIT